MKISIEMINIRWCLIWFDSGLVMRVFIVKLKSVVFKMGVRVGCEMFYFDISDGVMKFMVVVLKLFNRMIKKYILKISYWNGLNWLLLMMFCVLMLD